jgi:hypothetical protein
MRRIMVKVVSHVVTAVQEDDRILEETVGPATPCYSAEELTKLWERALAEVAAQNAVDEAAAVAAPAPNRATRRSGKGTRR